MIGTNETQITKHTDGNKLTVTRQFNAPLNKVWRAWTESEILDNWWAPKPWKAVTSKLDFRAGGQWLYAMTGPQGEKHLSRVDFHTIDPQKSFTATSFFCDEQGQAIDGAPVMHWKNEFEDAGAITHLAVEITLDSAANLEQIIQMGFKGGFTMALGNLDEILAQ